MSSGLLEENQTHTEEEERSTEGLKRNPSEPANIKKVE